MRQADNRSVLGQVVARIRNQNVTPGLVLIYARKFLHQAMTPRPERHAVLAILGCQRSGTSVMSRVFFRDLDAAVFREKSALTGGDEGLRYLPFPDLDAHMAKQKAPLVVFKMLVESQRALGFLDAVQGARVIWLFRNYRDVVNSNLTKFGADNGVDDLRPIIQAEKNNWRSESCSDATRNVVREHFSETMNPCDAAALFWYARNQLFFEQHLSSNKHVMLVEYEQFVQNPAEIMRKIYGFCGRPYPGDNLVNEVATGSVAKGKGVDISPEIDELCGTLLLRLQQTAIEQ